VRRKNGIVNSGIVTGNGSVSVSPSNMQRPILTNHQSPVFHNLKIRALKNSFHRICEKWKNTNKSFHQNIIFTLCCHYCKKVERMNRVVYPKMTRKHVQECIKITSSNFDEEDLLYHCICSESEKQNELMNFDAYCTHWLEHATYYKTCLRHKKNKIEDIHWFGMDT